MSYENQQQQKLPLFSDRRSIKAFCIASSLCLTGSRFGQCFKRASSQMPVACEENILTLLLK
jgi:hypothetical protein